MRILGVTSLFHDTGVAVLEKGKITHALNEERLSRKKMHLGFPHRSLEYIRSQVKKDFDVVAVSDIPAQELLQKIKFSMFDQSLLHPNPYITLKSQAMMTRWLWKTMKWYRYFQNEQALVFKKLGLPVKRLEHHVNHAASAYFTSGFKKCLVVTIDNHGDGICGSVSLGDKNQLVRLDTLPWPHSPGFFYAMITKVLGFKPGRHEGKITGLAAFGNVNSPVYYEIKKLMWFVDGTIRTRAMMGLRGWVYDLAKRYSREDLSAAFQRVLEEVVSAYIKFWMEKTGVFDVALAGGVFGNVKLNQRIIEAGAKKLFVHPHMGDGGTGAGAALHYAMVQGEAKPYEMPHAYLGPSYAEEEMKAELIKQGLPVERSDDIEGDVADVLAKDKVVAFFSGAMEYGPRALGARSVMYSAVDPKVNEWLNKQLNRSDFMPFAPVTLERFAKKCYKNFVPGALAARFMTVTFDCTDFMKDASPATVHVDGTARPQIISKDLHKSYNRVLEQYYKLTKIPSLVNTSFNMHEEPIVCSPFDAIRAFKLGHLDYLALGPFLVKNGSR
ncbi:MAG TPA: carbamoyltransferase C-terminal domain-containing protein [Candidatus Nanoarchaeia archaeon]|nr:carbamoyltransferase C-terminal domain-containing protein [Candidatus Nanoarchaeia archaeon]